MREMAGKIPGRFLWTATATRHGGRFGRDPQHGHLRRRGDLSCWAAHEAAAPSNAAASKWAESDGRDASSRSSRASGSRPSLAAHATRTLLRWTALGADPDLTPSAMACRCASSRSSPRTQLWKREQPARACRHRHLSRWRCLPDAAARARWSARAVTEMRELAAKCRGASIQGGRPPLHGRRRQVQRSTLTSIDGDCSYTGFSAAHSAKIRSSASIPSGETRNGLPQGDRDCAPGTGRDLCTQDTQSRSRKTKRRARRHWDVSKVRALSVAPRR